MDMREHRLGYREAMRKYFPHLNERSIAFLKQWERIFLEEGAEDFMKERQAEPAQPAERRKVDYRSWIQKLKRISSLKTSVFVWR